MILELLWYFALYFYCNYTYICWVNYRIGAGFNVNPAMKKFATDPFDSDFFFVFSLLTGPVIILIHIGCIVFYKLSQLAFLMDGVNSISPQSFYQRGCRDNDVDLQAEKHLLREKRKWYRFGF